MADETPAGPVAEPGSTPAAGPTGPSRLSVDRSRFGGTQRLPEPDREEDAPASRADLSKGAGELAGDRRTRINWQVLMISSAVILAFSVWAIFLPDEARVRMRQTVGWIALNLGWYYVITVTLVIAFVLRVAFSKEGNL